jgi:hypothetical protein
LAQGARLGRRLAHRARRLADEADAGKKHSARRPITNSAATSTRRASPHSPQPQRLPAAKRPAPPKTARPLSAPPKARTSRAPASARVSAK